METKTVQVDVSNVDWKLLREQKLFILELIGFKAIKASAREEEEIQKLDGILNLIDYIQDVAAHILGDEVVFGQDSKNDT